MTETEVEKLVHDVLNGTLFEAHAALKKLGEHKGAKIPAPVFDRLLETATRARNHVTRMNAIYAMGMIGDERVIPDLLEILKEGSSPQDASAALRELTTRGPFGMSSRARAATTDLPEVRRAAASALGMIGGKAALRALLECLREDWAWSVRASAAHALGMMKSKTALPVLESMLRTERETAVREEIGKAVQAIKGA